MRWKIKNKRECHKWFAWYHVRVGGERVWLEFVERKLFYGYRRCWYEHRNIKNLNT